MTQFSAPAPPLSLGPETPAGDTLQPVASGPPPLRITLSRAKGWRMPPRTVKVDRSAKLGNPFIVGEHGTRARCVDLYRLMLRGLLCASNGPPIAEQMRAVDTVILLLPELRGKNLACWCPQGAPCHGDVLLELANLPQSKSTGACEE